MAAPEDNETAGYQVLSVILQSSLNDSGDYEDPTPLLENTPQQHPPAKSQRQRSDVPRPYSLLGDGQGSQKSLLAREKASDSDGESEEEGLPSNRAMVIRQSQKGQSANAIEQSTGRIDIVGNIVQPDAPFSFKSKSKKNSQQRNGELKSPDEIQEEGIYQGLKMTNEEKRRIGILPESMYMTLNLENWAEELENMSLKVQAAPSPSLPPGRVTEIPQSRLHAKRRSVPVISMTQQQRPITPRFRGSIVRAPPLPPLAEGSTQKEKMVYGVVENLLRSEAAFLTSLNIAIDVYMKPLSEMADGPSPVISKDQITNLFGPLPELIVHHELFYTALTSRTMEWSSLQRVGDIFMSSFNTKEVIRHYSAFVNNFTLAMSTLETCIKKKMLFVRYLRSKYEQSNTSLSLQGLLLKPIQRFPQYILFLQDLLKFTPDSHPDRVNLQIALARFEGIAIFLNEAKRMKEQYSVVQHLNSKVTGLPFELLDGRRWLYRQDTVGRLLVLKTGKVKRKPRCLLLFNNILLCAAARLKNKRGVLESSTGSRDFRATEGVHYLSKWHSPLETVELVEPDYITDVWDSTLPTGNSVALEQYRELKSNYKKLEHDYHTMTSITNLVSTLHEDYPGLTVQAVNNLIRVLQRKLAKAKEDIKTLQPGRLDISIPSRDGTKLVQHTYVFENEKTKQNWLNALRYAKLHLTKPNLDTWAFADDTADEDFFEISHKLPLSVDSFQLSMLENFNSIECAAKVGRSSAWLASGDRTSAQITVVECVTPHPFIVECFKLDCARVIDMVYIPGGREGTESATMKQTLPRGVTAGGNLTLLPPNIDTVWMGSQCGKLLVFLATSSEGTRRCLSSVQLPDSVTCIQFSAGKVFVATAQGGLAVFKRNTGVWDMGKHVTIPVSEDSIKCMCLVERKLWICSKTTCFILDTVTQRIEGQLEFSCCEGVTVNKMVACGSGVWVSYRGCPHIEMFHTGTRNALQNIDIRAAMKQIVSRHRLESKIQSLDNIHVSCLMASDGYLWIGTSVGSVLIFRIPHLEGVPLTSGKPYLAKLGHQDSVRVLLTVETLATVSDTRVDQFLSDEHHRNIGEGAEITDDEELIDGKFECNNGRVYEERSFLDHDRSLTPSLPDPSLIASVDIVNKASTLPQSHQQQQQGQLDVSKLSPSSRRRLPYVRSDSALLDSSNLNRSGMFRSGLEDKLEERLQSIHTQSGEDDWSISGQGLPREEKLRVSIENDLPLTDEQSEKVEENGEAQLEWIKKEARSYSQVEANGDDTLLKSQQPSMESDLMSFNEEASDSPPNVDIAFAGDFTEDVITSSGEEVEDGRSKVQAREETDFLESQSPVWSGSDRESTPKVILEADDDDVDFDTMRRVPTPESLEETIYDEVAPDEGTLKQREGRSPSPYETPHTLERTGPIPPLGAILSPSETLAQALPRGSLQPQQGAIFVLTAGRGLLNLRPEDPSSSPFFRRTNTAGGEGAESFLVAYEIEH